MGSRWWKMLAGIEAAGVGWGAAAGAPPAFLPQHNEAATCPFCQSVAGGWTRWCPTRPGSSPSSSWTNTTSTLWRTTHCRTQTPAGRRVRAAGAAVVAVQHLLEKAGASGRIAAIQAYCKRWAGSINLQFPMLLKSHGVVPHLPPPPQTTCTALSRSWGGSRRRSAPRA